jgi:hypothetical protein
VSGYEKIADLLSCHIPKDFLLAWEAAAASEIERAAALGASRSVGHRSHFIGSVRHYGLNEAFDRALKDAGLDHTPLSGNRIVVGSAGITFLSRLHINKKGPWDNSKRSAGRVKLCAKNVAATQAVQPDFLSGDMPITLPFRYRAQRHLSVNRPPCTWSSLTTRWICKSRCSKNL